MNEFPAKIIHIVSLLLGAVLLLIGIGLLAGLVYEFPGGDSSILLGLGTMAVLSFSLAAFLLRIGTMKPRTCKPVWRTLLIALGVLSLLLAAGLAIGLFVDLKKEGPGFGIFFLCSFVLLPAALGYFLFRIAANQQENPRDAQRSRVRLYRLGQVMFLCFVLAIAVYLPTAGKLAAVLLLALIFARIHGGWSGRRFRTPMGTTSYAEVFDFIVQGTLYLAVQVIFALLTGSVGSRQGGSSRGGGGSSGGGGASGKW